MPSNEGRNGFRFVEREAVTAARDNMKPGIRHPVREMESNGDWADRIGVPPDQKRRGLDPLDWKFRGCRRLRDPTGGARKLLAVLCPPIGGAESGHVHTG